MKRLLLLVLVASCAHPVPVVEPVTSEAYNIPDEATDADRVCVRTVPGATWRLCLTVGTMKRIIAENRQLPNTAKVNP